MSEWFHVGQKVVCVDDGHWARCSPKPVKDGIYTIREMEVRAGEIGLRFIEIVSRPTDPRFDPPGNEFFFQAKYFRPLRKRTTDISCFKAMLEPSKQGADA